jgi:putative transposase
MGDTFPVFSLRTGMPWTTPKIMNIRAQFAARAADPNANISELCREYNISRKTGYKWLERYLAKGVQAMGDASRKPKNSPASLCADTVCELVRLRVAHPTWGARKIAELFKRSGRQAPCESSIKRVFDKAGLSEKRRPRRVNKTGGILRTGFKAAGCNDVWTIDFKGSWYDPEGKSNPLTVRDEFSRYVLELRHLERGTTEAVMACFEALFTKHGLPRVIRSDNGQPFACTSAIFGLTKLSTWFMALGISLERGRPGRPQDNGGHERMHADIAREIEAAAKCQRKEPKRIGQRQASFDLWREEFNGTRPHESLGMQRPADVYKASERAYEPGGFALQYEGMQERRVGDGGTNPGHPGFREALLP